MTPPTKQTLPHLAPITTTLSLLALIIHFSPTLSSLLQYDRNLIQFSQIHRLITSHLTHWSTDHLLWDLLTFFILGSICEKQTPKRFIATLLLSTATISVTLISLMPQFQFYRGLSGIDSALFILLAANLFNISRTNHQSKLTAFALFMIAAFLIKTTFESITANTLFVDSQTSGFTPLPLAHLAGGIAGLIAGFISQPITILVFLNPKTTHS